jgi:hydroxymethylbilane synthase
MNARLPQRIIVGSRASDLSRAQTTYVIEQLRRALPEIEFKHRVVMTTGDKDRKTKFEHLGGGGGAFTKELELSLVEREIDVAVHSLKDVPTLLPPGLRLSAVPTREESRDALCGYRLAELPVGARIGTGSPRRQAQMLRVRPDVRIVAIRGNVPPRLRRLRGEHPLDAVILAAAGLRRLRLQDSISELLPLDDFPPSPAQGALGLEIRKSDEEIHAILQVVHDQGSYVAVHAERAFMRELEAGCSVPLGAYAAVADDKVTLCGQVLALDGSESAQGSVTGSAADPEAVGRALAEVLRGKGVESILRRNRHIEATA